MVDDVRKEFGDIVSLHQKIISVLTAQKARQDQMTEKYSDDIDKELELPSNRFLRWSGVVRIFADSVVSGKLMDYELISQYEKFVKDLVRYESQYVRSEEEVEALEYGFDMSTETVLRLESKMLALKKELEERIVRAQTRAINLYKEKGVREEGCCVLCGVELSPDDEEECVLCKGLPKAVKPFRSKVLSVPENEVVLPEETEEKNTYISTNENTYISTDKYTDENTYSEEEQEEEEINNSEEPEKEETKEKAPEGTTKKDKELKKQFEKLMSGITKYEEDPKEEENAAKKGDDY